MNYQNMNKNTLIIKDVYGNDVFTNEIFNQMRKQLEKYIEFYSTNIEIINTTKVEHKLQELNSRRFPKL